jgi:hypothetical protein
MSNSQPKLGRGKKLCIHCNEINGVRSFECNKCGQAFKMKKGPKGIRKKRIEDFKSLNKGDWIKVVGGSGPYHIDSEGERTYLVERGKYKVEHTDSEGIHAYGDSGYNYLYMGKSCPSPLLDSIVRSPCKILLLKNMPASRKERLKSRRT